MAIPAGYDFAISRRAARPRFASTWSLLTEGAGKAGCPEHPQSVCRKCTRWTTSTPENTRLSPRNGFNGFLRALPGDEFLFVTVASRIVICPGPVGPAKSPRGLTSATDARTTRLRRTQRPPPNASTRRVRQIEVLAEALKRRSSARRSIAHSRSCPAITCCAPTLPRPPHPIPRP